MLPEATANIVIKFSRHFRKLNFCDTLNNPQEMSTCYIHFISTNYYISNLKVISKSCGDKVLKDQPEYQLCLATSTALAARIVSIVRLLSKILNTMF